MPNPNRRISVVGPVILIVIGALFLLHSLRPEFNPWSILWTYWPLILIAVGLGKIWDYSRQRQAATDPNAAGSGRGNAFSVGTTIAIVAFVLVVIAAMWHGGRSIRARNFGGGSLSHEEHVVDLQGAKKVNASIQMGAGELTIRGGEASHLLDASFDYYARRSVPEVRYNVSNGTGQLEIDESRSGPNVLIPGNRNGTTWNLRLGNQVPMELEVNLGAGEGQLRLRDLPITKLDLRVGAGTAEVDLTGNRTHDLDVTITGGVGEATIRLPKNIGVLADVSGGLGSVDTRGMKKDGSEYVNDAYGHTPVTIRLHVSGGIGSINLIEEN
jgi:uncharacterized protein DUF2154/cell wall-active antibiotic response 4TMS protein YvqF